MNKKFAFWTVAVIVVFVAIAAIFFAKPATPETQLITRAFYSCDGGKTITASFYKNPVEPPAPAPGQPPTPNGSAVVDLDANTLAARTMTLAQTISADGGRYANTDESFVFWSKGYGAFVMENKITTYANCLQQLPTQSFTNAAGGYSFSVPNVWSAVVNQYNAKNSLFGPDASSSAGLGGVEVFANQKSVQAFMSGVAAKYSNKTAITVDGVQGLRMNYDGGVAGNGEQVTVLKNGTIYNIYIGSMMDDDLGFFNQVVQSFRFAQ